MPAGVTAGEQTWNGTDWGTCKIDACAEGYSLTNNQCVSDEYTIEYVDPLFAENPNPDSYTVEDLPLTLEDLTYTGYTFKGWSTSKTATSATYTAGADYKKEVKDTLYAVWKRS
jgi:uncharacterized repeat protein (TIGR02543 family)